MEKFQQAGKIYQEINDRSENAGLAWLASGLISDNLGKKADALKFYDTALRFFQEIKDQKWEATTLNNIGGVYSSLGEKQKALEFYNLALPLRRQVGDKSGEATTLNNIGLVYSSLGEKQKALEFYNLALPLSRQVGDRSGEATTLNNVMYVWEILKNPSIAVFYGKQSVNKYQELRQNIKGLDQKIQTTYLKSVEDTYRKLADILIEKGRIAEAEQVLEMLKEEEYFSYLRRDGKVADQLVSRVLFRTDEQKAFEEYEKLADSITLVGQELGELEKKRNALGLGKSLSEEDQKRYDELKAKLDLANENFKRFLEDLKVRFAKEDKRIAQVESGLKALLNRLNQSRTVIISTIAGEDKLNLILTTAYIQKAYQVSITSAELNQLVADFRDALKDPSVDPRPLGKNLYDKLFPLEMQKELAAIKTDTLVWSLDGTLRYVPMAALFDGKQYLVERYDQAVITLASRQRLEEEAKKPRKDWLAFGVGVSKSYKKFDALPAVPKELCSVVKDAKQKDFCEKLDAGGVFNGLMYQDENFTDKNFEDNIGKVEVVHIASHFDLKINDKESSLLLGCCGDERKYSVERFNKLTENSLQRIELLTLSACNTAMSAGENANGIEVEGFGALAQNKGVKTVLATLWAVNDDSTGNLMTEFYKILEENSKIGKAEALRLAQLKLIQGEYKTLEESTSRGVKTFGQEKQSEQIPFKKDDKAPFKHPYFWSPFVLSGNWK